MYLQRKHVSAKILGKRTWNVDLYVSVQIIIQVANYLRETGKKYLSCLYIKLKKVWITIIHCKGDREAEEDKEQAICIHVQNHVFIKQAILISVLIHS